MGHNMIMCILSLLMILAARADTFSSYNLGDNEQWKRYNWELLITIATGLLLLVLLYANGSILMIAVEFLYFAVVVKTFVLAQASMLASKAVLQKKAKLVADYTIEEHLKNDQDEVDLTTMEGYTYLVRGEEEDWKHGNLVQRSCLTLCFEGKKVVKAEAPLYHVMIKSGPQVITIEKVWQCQGELLKARDSNHRIKDFCLSFALFKILSTKFADYLMPQNVYHKSWKLFQEILKDDYERAFRIIEVELTFVFYQFFSKYPYIFQPHHWGLKFAELVLVSISSCIIASFMWEIKKEGMLTIDDIVTTAMIIVFVILEILQFLCMIISEWGKVVLICNYVMRKSWQKKCIENLVEFICHIELLKPWDRKLYQYSLLESYKYSPCWLLYNNLTAALIDQKKEGRQQGTPVELSTTVKSAVIRSLPIAGTSLENGKNSLIRNDMRICLWACKLETQAHVIMVWHIATRMCEHELPIKDLSHSDTPNKFKIATNLSKYLAYLVAFAPRLLPDHPYVTEFVFDQVINEARETFKKCTSLEDRTKELKDKCSSEGGKTVINRGAHLGKQLLSVKEPDRVWNALADFWAELMIYVAPSEDMEAHVEKLTMGGEFITQIWLLLLHSGIKRSSSLDTNVGEESKML